MSRWPYYDALKNQISRKSLARTISKLLAAERCKHSACVALSVAFPFVAALKTLTPYSRFITGAMGCTGEGCASKCCDEECPCRFASEYSPTTCSCEGKSSRARSFSARQGKSFLKSASATRSRRSSLSYDQNSGSLLWSDWEFVKNSATNSLMFYAVAENNADLITKLLARKESDVGDLSLGLSLLHEAAALGSSDCLQVLIDAGVDVNITDLNGRTPLEYAVFAGHFETASQLIESGADVRVIRNGLIL